MTARKRGKPRAAVRPRTTGADEPFRRLAESVFMRAVGQRQGVAFGSIQTPERLECIGPEVVTLGLVAQDSQERLPCKRMAGTAEVRQRIAAALHLAVSNRGEDERSDSWASEDKRVRKLVLETATAIEEVAHRVGRILKRTLEKHPKSAEKYPTSGSRKWVEGFAEEARMRTTLELVPG